MILNANPVLIDTGTYDTSDIFDQFETAAGTGYDSTILQANLGTPLLILGAFLLLSQA